MKKQLELIKVLNRDLKSFKRISHTNFVLELQNQHQILTLDSFIIKRESVSDDIAFFDFKTK